MIGVQADESTRQQQQQQYSYRMIFCYSLAKTSNKQAMAELPEKLSTSTLSFILNPFFTAQRNTPIEGGDRCHTGSVTLIFMCWDLSWASMPIIIIIWIMISTIEGMTGYKQNIEAVSFLVYQNHFVIDPNSQFTNIKSSLKIDKNTLNITEEPKKEENDITNIPLVTKKYSAFLGILPVLSQSFLVLVDEVKFACTIQKHDIFEVASIAFIQKDKNSLQKDEKRKAIESYLYYMKEVIFKQGFYFSYTYDLTLSRVKYAEGYPLNLNYCWNAHLSKKLLDLKDQSWILPMIQGYVKTFNSFIQGKKIQYFLIIRRAWKKGGTRYNARGIDEKGNVSNFCESQQIVIYNDFLCSHVQIRGSVPVFWKQSGITAKVEFYREHQPTKTAFKRHFQQLKQSYNNVLVCNLLAKKRSGQQALTTYFETLIKEFNFPHVRYQYFDFHMICKGQKFQRANYLLDKIKELNESFRFYAEDTLHAKVLITQKGVIRTNCSDCLDRTNYVQTKIAIQILQSMLKLMNVNISQALGYDSLVTALDKKSTTSQKLIINFKNIWADGGDTISCLYTGTGSTHTNVTRTGERDLVGIMDHGMKTLGRFYQQNIQDWYKQQVIDLLLGQHTNTINLAEFEAKMKEMKVEGKRHNSL